MSASSPDADGPGGSIIRVIDLETSGRDASDGGIVEIGWQDLRRAADGAWALSGPPLARLTHPGGPITPATSAIHHITDDDVRDAPPFTTVAPAILRPQAPLVAFAAHRAAFEQRWIHGSLPAPRGTGPRWICTYKCALRLWPDEPGHSNQGLRYSRRPAGLDRALGHPAHRAGPDAYVTAHHLRDMLALAPVETLLRWSREPALLVKVPHGPLRGRRIRQLDPQELDRILRDDRGRSPDLAFTIRTEQARRRGAADAGTADRPVQPCLPL
ncbi:exodeoxyribonuclease [Gluconacetobacter johannae DSM 13595]|uniref:DNA polymerase III subunit epsilon n=1 Tax=Gluconacetobacter johannae TaxID=112140 RepID=A0A7W4P3Y7_9PROT|nr:exonuclease domain-containing protein [Gluconacetobacter johannae]MBB2174508.1 DNA polymerase III subunit epsilon [Gluconacetobacter johannae]GBQ84597.1 exodeoxyribonuclease [Gluconacetobacter johannae DSM 13595]